MSTPRITVIVQARMGSQRLPGKVLADIRGHPMLSRVIQRLRRARTPYTLVIATTDLERDAPIIVLANRLGVAPILGPEEDVLARYCKASRETQADIVVRVTADCPLIDPEVVDHCVTTYLTANTFDYVSNTLRRTYPRGLDVEVFARSALERAAAEATAASDREHVTPFIWKHPEEFRLGHVQSSRDVSHLRWTVDTSKDLEMVRAVYSELEPVDPEFGWNDVLELVERKPWIAHINASVHQKPL